MKELNYWNEFMNSGKIEDYLSFKMLKNEKTDKENTSNEAENAGFCDSNRNGNKDAPYWGFR